jgi:hypothetical protein
VKFFMRGYGIYQTVCAHFFWMIRENRHVYRCMIHNKRLAVKIHPRHLTQGEELRWHNTRNCHIMNSLHLDLPLRTQPLHKNAILVAGAVTTRCQAPVGDQAIPVIHPHDSVGIADIDH